MWIDRSGERGISRAALLMVLLAVALVAVPGMFWWGTWFGRRLGDAELIERLSGDAKPRHVQHAVHEIARRLDEARPGSDRWCTELVRVSRRDEVEVRVGAAWAMQFDSVRPEFVERLREMVRDPAPTVRRNAATSLARGGDDAGLHVLREMLSTHTVLSPVPGDVTALLAADQPVREGLSVASIRLASGETYEVRAELPGHVVETAVKIGAPIGAGEPLLSVAPSDDHLRNGIAGLALVGRREDVPLVRGWADPRASAADDVRAAAEAAAQVLESR